VPLLAFRKIPTGHSAKNNCATNINLHKTESVELLKIFSKLGKQTVEIIETDGTHVAKYIQIMYSFFVTV
jgi:hypothetical protein